MTYAKAADAKAAADPPPVPPSRTKPLPPLLHIENSATIELAPFLLCRLAPAPHTVAAAIAAAAKGATIAAHPPPVRPFRTEPLLPLLHIENSATIELAPFLLCRLAPAPLIFAAAIAAAIGATIA